MKNFTHFIFCIAFALTLAACSEDHVQTIKGTYVESVKIAETYMGQAVEAWQESEVNLCDLSDEQWANFVGGLSTGTAITGALAGDSIIVLLTSAGGIAVVAHAVATGVTVAAGTVAATYGGIKAYCELKGMD